MSKTITGYHVEVHPRRLGNFGCVSVGDRLVERDDAKRLALYRERCEEIVEGIRRHVDNVEWVGVVEDIEESE